MLNFVIEKTMKNTIIEEVREVVQYKVAELSLVLFKNETEKELLALANELTEVNIDRAVEIGELFGDTIYNMKADKIYTALLKRDRGNYKKLLEEGKRLLSEGLLSAKLG